MRKAKQSETELIQKSKRSHCRCHHPTFSEGMCHYRTCRHSIGTHLGYSTNNSDPDLKIIDNDEVVQAITKYLHDNPEKIKCDCGRSYRTTDIGQIKYENHPSWTFLRCANCLYDLASSKFFNRIVKRQIFKEIDDT